MSYDHHGMLSLPLAATTTTPNDHRAGRYHPRAPKPATASADDATDHIPSYLAGDTDDDALQYVGQVHQFPTRSTRSQ